MPTVLELTREQWKKYLEPARRRLPPSGLSPAERQARELLLQRVRDAAALLRQRFGARRVVLFGSLAHTAWFHPQSDVDIAVEGLAGDAYWKAWQLLEDQIPDRSIDLVEIETAGDSLRLAIQRSGVEL